MEIDHICFAVKNLNDGIAYWERMFGYEQMTLIVENSIQKVKVCFLKKYNSITIKLIEPLEGNQSVINFVDKGGGFHHLCFKCDNIDESYLDFKRKGLLTLVSPQPGEAFNNNKIALLLAKHGIIFELIDTEEKAGII